MKALELSIFQNKFKKLIDNKNIISNIYKIQANDSLMSGYFCIGFIDFRLKGKRLLDYTSLISPKKFENNVEIILKQFQ